MNRFKKIKPDKQIAPDTLSLLNIAFLLLLFFVFIHYHSRYRIMEIIAPVEEIYEGCFPGCGPASQVLNVLIDSGGVFMCYNGLGEDPMNPPQFFYCSDIIELRKKIKEHKLSTRNKIQSGYMSPRFQTAVLIKQTSQSSFGDFVNVLNEMAVNKVSLYTFQEAAAFEQYMLQEINRACNDEKFLVDCFMNNK